MKKIRTVTGDVSAEKMGRTLTHEHLLYTYPGGEYDHVAASISTTPSIASPTSSRPAWTNTTTAPLST